MNRLEVQIKYNMYSLYYKHVKTRNDSKNNSTAPIDQSIQKVKLET
jgi:hypothetical protein